MQDLISFHKEIGVLDTVVKSWVDNETNKMPYIFQQDFALLYNTQTT